MPGGLINQSVSIHFISNKIVYCLFDHFFKYVINCLIFCRFILAFELILKIAANHSKPKIIISNIGVSLQDFLFLEVTLHVSKLNPGDTQQNSDTNVGKPANSGVGSISSPLHSNFSLFHVVHFINDLSRQGCTLIKSPLQRSKMLFLHNMLSIHLILIFRNLDGVKDDSDISSSTRRNTNSIAFHPFLLDFARFLIIVGLK